MKNILIICATPFNEEEFWEQAPLAKYLNKVTCKQRCTTYNEHCEPIDFYIAFENQKGLPLIYNKFLTTHPPIPTKDKILVFVHDDVSIEDVFLHQKLNEAIQRFDVIGLAGGSKVSLKHPSLWHLLTDKNTHTGAVAHQWPNGDIAVSTYGPTPRRCLMVDGLFLAINTEKVMSTGLWFDPNYSFHHWDLQFGLDANKLNLKIGTWPIFCIHSGLGDSYMSNAWQESEKIFLKTNS